MSPEETRRDVSFSASLGLNEYRASRRDEIRDVTDTKRVIVKTYNHASLNDLSTELPGETAAEGSSGLYSFCIGCSTPPDIPPDIGVARECRRCTTTAKTQKILWEGERAEFKWEFVPVCTLINVTYLKDDH